MIYAIQAGNKVKIGYSVRPHRRADSLRTAHYEEVAVIAVMEGGKKKERAIHELFTEYRIRGEWFSFVPFIREWIAAHMSPVEDVAHRHDTIDESRYIHRSISVRSGVWYNANTTARSMGIGVSELIERLLSSEVAIDAVLESIGLEWAI